MGMERAAVEMQSKAPTVMGPILFTKIELVLEQKGQRTFHFENSVPLQKNVGDCSERQMGMDVQRHSSAFPCQQKMKNSV